MAALVSPVGSGRPPGGDADGGWRAYIGLSVPSFAWEFLRRNPDYRRDFADSTETVDARWGLRFPADPEATAAEADVYWRADIAPGIVVPVASDRAGLSGPIVLRLPDGRVRAGEDGLHVRLTAGLQLLLRERDEAFGPLVVMLRYDAHLGLRVRAVEALDRAARGRPPMKSRLTMAQRLRLARSLVALDGRLRGDSYRAIASDVFGDGAVSAEAWRTASLRAATIRLAQTGKALMEGGYLQLLAGGL
jgi:hypothetical protein